MQRGIFFGLRRLSRNLFYQFRPQGLLKMADDLADGGRLFEVAEPIANSW